jgi:hypothetical protein
MAEDGRLQPALRGWGYELLPIALPGWKTTEAVISECVISWVLCGPTADTGAREEGRRRVWRLGDGRHLDHPFSRISGFFLCGLGVKVSSMNVVPPSEIQQKMERTIEESDDSLTGRHPPAAPTILKIMPKLRVPT